MLIDPTYLTIQTTSIVLVALLLRLLAGAASARFMAYWSMAWFALAVALASLALQAVIPDVQRGQEMRGFRLLAVSLFCILEYTCGFFLWAGARQYAKGRPLQRVDSWRLMVPILLALVAPWIAPTPQQLFPLHAALCSLYFLTSLVVLLPTPPSNRLATVGLRITQMSLAGLVILFAWYAVVPMPHSDLYSIHFSPIYDGLVVTFLGFGLVILATDFTQNELLERNRKLAEITEQLAVAARTDSLTGLLNRRAFDAMLADRAGSPYQGSVAVMDVNDLKILNDRYGHKTGDSAIQIVARSLRSHFRITDPIFRVGGDEFLVLLEDGKASELAFRLESVDRSLQGIRLPSVEGAKDLHIAWGIHDFDRVEDLPDAIEQADQEMYRCKAARKALTQRQR